MLLDQDEMMARLRRGNLLKTEAESLARTFEIMAKREAAVKANIEDALEMDQSMPAAAAWALRSAKKLLEEDSG